MQRANAKPPRQSVWLEQVAVLATSMIWTAVILLIITFVWAYQDAQARWEMIRNQPTPIPAALLPQSIPSTPTETPEPTATATPAPTKSPTPTATYVLDPPEVLPETPLDAGTASEPTAQPTQTPVPPTSTPTPATESLPTNTPVPTPAPPPVANSGPTRLVIRSVGIDTPVLPVGWSIFEQNGHQYSVWDVADYAAGWHNTSAPAGQPGNTVLAGHHNIKGEVFRYLVDVEEGDQVDVYVGDTVYRYYVEQKLVLKEKGEPLEVRRQNAQWIAPTNDVRVTLVTCWPYTNNTHRVIVVAKPGS